MTYRWYDFKDMKDKPVKLDYRVMIHDVEYKRCQTGVFRYLGRGHAVFDINRSGQEIHLPYNMIDSCVQI